VAATTHAIARCYHRGMAMTLRLTDEETELLRRQAERERRSMHEVARLAIIERARRAEHGERVIGETRRVLERHRDVLDALRDA
jgi:predicted transcriptional regulator